MKKAVLIFLLLPLRLSALSEKLALGFRTGTMVQFPIQYSSLQSVSLDVKKGLSPALQSLIIERTADGIKIRHPDCLAIPGENGWTYAALISSPVNGPDSPGISVYPYYSKSLSSVKAKMKKTSLPDKTIHRYEVPEFVTSRFVITRGFLTTSTRGNTWKYLEFSDLKHLNLTAHTDNHVETYFSPSQRKQIIKQAACTPHYLGMTRCDDQTLLPFSTSIDRLQGLHFSFEYLQGELRSYALVPLWRDFKTQYLAKVRLHEIPGNLIKDLHLKEQNPELPPFIRNRGFLHATLSPTRKTVVLFYPAHLEIWDVPSEKRLYKYSIPFSYSQLIMVEWTDN